MKPRLVLLATGICALLVAQPAAGPNAAESVKATYTKYEHRIPMRDGKRLFTSLYVPKDTTRQYPILLQRTPYSVSPYGVDRYRSSLGPSDRFMREGFIFAYQDVRGRVMSEGEFLEMTPHRAVKRSSADVDESTDTYDTIDWLVKHVPGNNGRVGTYGTSYPGFFTAAGMIDAHPAHKAASPQAPMADLYMGDDAYHNGCLMLAHNFGFYQAFKPQTGPQVPPRIFTPPDFGTPDGYDYYLNRLGVLAESGQGPYWRDTVAHFTYDDHWKARNLLPHLKNIRPAVLTVGGWFDAEDLPGPLKVYRAVENNQPPAANTLVMGPWRHGGWNGGDGDRLGDIRFGVKTGEYFRDQVLFPFFMQHLKGKDDARLPKALMFETGTNLWRRFDLWPPRGAARTLYLRAGGRLSFDPPTEETAFDEYLSDPNRPVPLVGYIAQGMPSDYMVQDQRFAGTRPDVLVYRTEVLEEDLTLAGPIRPVLHVSTSGTDSDFVVKLIDVYPDDYPDNEPNPAGVRMGGYQQLVRGDPFRGKFRHSFETAQPFAPGRVEKIEFDMPDICHTFRRGHRILVQVQSTWFPLVDRNPQKFMEIPKAKPEDFQRATQRVYRSRTAASRLQAAIPQ